MPSSAFLTASNPAGALNGNPTFQAWGSLPSGWAAVGSPTVSQVAGLVSPYAARVAAAAEVLGGLSDPCAPLAAGWFIIQAVITLQAGALTGASVDVNCFTDTSYATPTETVSLVFATDADITATINGAGTVGTTYRFIKLVQTTNPLTAVGVLSANAHDGSSAAITDPGFDITDGQGGNIGDGSDSSAVANTIDFSLCLIRLATPAEISGVSPPSNMAVFPLLPGQQIEFTKAPTWSTKVKRAASGRERRTEQWPFPLWAFETGFGVIRRNPTNDELAVLWEFFNLVQGQVTPWLLLDATDYVVSSGPVGTGDGVTTSFQVQRALDTFIEPVLAPFGMSVFDNGAAAGAYALGANGVITFTTAPAAGHVITWSGYFYFVCRFTQDDLTFDQFVAGLWGGKSLKFTSFRS